jgi:hypothetical protein
VSEITSRATSVAAVVPTDTTRAEHPGGEGEPLWPGQRRDGSIGDVSDIRAADDSTNVLSLYSEDSVLCIGCRGSVLSIGSIGSVLSIGSVGSMGSVLSVASFCAAGSLMSGVAVLSVLSWRSRRRILAGGE